MESQKSKVKSGNQKSNISFLFIYFTVFSLNRFLKVVVAAFQK